MRYIALTIAGSDSCGGAGIQADLKTFMAHEVYGMSVVTAVTAQNTLGVLSAEDISPEMISEQINALFSDCRIDGVKIGMVSNRQAIMAIAQTLNKYDYRNLVVDPVMLSKNNYPLLNEKAQTTLIKELFPMATLVTPNLPEAAIISGISVNTLDDMRKAAMIIHKLGPKNVLIKGGHLKADAIDLLFDGTTFTEYCSLRIPAVHTHGTGCTLSSAITANLSKGIPLVGAIGQAKHYVHHCIEHGFSIGKGIGPVHHLYNLYKHSNSHL
jgi:hydroxymethylpyrimidine/phosphomethylpyrimidine kinase